MDNAQKAKQNQAWSASNRALELLGRELGMFGERSFQMPTRWEELPESIQAEIIENLNARVQALEAEERAKLEAQKQLPAGEQTVDVTGD